MPLLRPAGSLAALVILAATILAPATQAATLTVHGSTTVSNAVMVPHKDDIEKASGLTLDIVSNGSGRGLADLVAGKTDVAMISAPLEDEVKAANAKMPGSIDPAKLEGHRIGDARVAFIVHPSNPVKSLTLPQITDILAHRITNWSAVGGADMPIVVVAATPGDGVRSMVEGQLLQGTPIAQARELPTATQVVQVTGQMPAGLGLTAAASVRPGVTVLQTDRTLGQPLILVTMGPPSPDAMKLIAAATAAAQ
jgi:phosphate transport system substrate-binding protein